MKKEATLLGTAFANTVRSYMADMVLLGDYYKATGLVHQLVKENSFIGYIYILGEHKEIFTHSFNELTDVEKLTYSNPVIKLESVQLVRFRDKIYRDIGIKMIDGIDYEIHIGVKENNIIDAFNRTISSFVIACIVIAIFAAFISYFISGYIIKPIITIVDFSHNLIDHKFGIQLPLKGSTDIHRLTQNMNTLSLELKHYEDQIQQDFREMLVVEKLNVLNNFKAGMLHEIKNATTALKLLVSSSSSEDFDEEDFNIIACEVNKIDHIMQSLFADMPEQLEVRIANIQNILSLTLEELKPLANAKSIKIHFIEKENIVLVKCYPILIQLMLSNLLDNALEAIGTFGNIYIEVETSEDGTSIEICDDGDGIDPLIIEKLCEPFYTTKKKGSGLGLYLVHNVTRLHNGSMSIKNKDNGDTVFKVILRGLS
ncbi:sensor histidine kinase [Denitrovibrio acetiphilus]|nr:HAMP domain-containing sensor histidine kinase [Denitrovibrio acetiphilus]